MNPAAIDFKAGFGSYVATKAKVWKHDRMKTLGGSEAFGCLRKAFLLRNGAAVDPDHEESWGATERGNLIEDNLFVPGVQHIAEMVGGNAHYTSADEGGQTTLFAKDAPLSVTPDGLIDGVDPAALSAYGIPDLRVPAFPMPDVADMVEYADYCFTVECKSIDPRVNLSEEKAIHRGQVMTQIGTIRENTFWRPNYGVIVYFDASFLDNIEIFVVPYDPSVYETAKERARFLFATKSADLFLREGVYDDSCKNCKFSRACNGATLAALPPQPEKKGGKFQTDPALASQLEPLVIAQQRAKAEEDRAKKAAAQASEQIKLLLRGHRVPRAAGEGWGLSYYPQAGKPSLDREALKADGIDLANYEKQGEAFEVLKVTLKDPVLLE